MKKWLCALCLLALTAGMLCLPAGATGGGDILKAGYGKRSITPQCSVPMSGYGNTTSRFCEMLDSATPRLIDDNGDGQVGVNDGLFCACILLEDGEGNRLLLMSYDMIGTVPGLLTKMQNRLSKEPYNIRADHLYMNASHSHSAPDMSWYFSYVGSMGVTPSLPYDGDTLSASYYDLTELEQTAVQNVRQYTYDVLLPGLMGAVDDALADLAPASMSTGAIQIPNMNHIRHGYDKADSTDDADVYGVNTRGGGTMVKQYGTVNDTMYLLRFDREGKAPIAAVDWRAHGTNSSTSGSNYGLDNRYRISSDFIGSFRDELEKAGYLAAYFQGTAGNVVTNSVLNGGVTGANNTTDPEIMDMWTYNGTSKRSVISPLYGKKLATFALQGFADDMEPASAVGGIQSQRRYIYETLDVHENYKMVGGVGQDGKTVEGMLYEQVTDSKGVTYSVYDYLQKYYAYTTIPSAERTKVTSLLNKYNLNSYYHLGRIVSKFHSTMVQQTDDQGRPVTDGQGRPLYVQKASVKGGFYVYAFSVGEDLGGVTVPFENFDAPYDFRGEVFRTTFVLGYTNGYGGYLPDEPTYRFAGGRGAYEANNTAYAPGTAEHVAAIQRSMLRGMDRSALPEVCPACGETVTWEPLTISAEMESGHYYLTSDAEGTLAQMNVRSGKKVCIYLNGNSLVSTGTTTSRLLASYAGGEVNVMNGTLQSQGAKITIDPNTGLPVSSPYQNAGVILNHQNSTVRLYDVTVRYRVAQGQWSQYGGAVSALGNFEMHGGTVIMEDPDALGAPTQYGGLFFVGSKGTLHVTDGLITGGRTVSDGLGDQIYANSGAKIILDGDTQVDGGVFLSSGVSLTLADRAKILRGDRYPLYVDPDAPRVNAAGLTEGASVWVAAPELPRAMADVASAEQAAYFHYDGCGRITHTAGTVTAAPFPEVCPACGQAADWQPLTPEGEMASGHYYLTEDVQGALPQKNVRSGVKVCIDLNGFSARNTGTTTSRTLAVFTGGEANLMNGTIQSQGAKITLDPDTGEPLASPYQNAGVILNHPNSTVRLYNVTVRCLVAPGQWSQYGGAISALGHFEMHGGRVVMDDPEHLGSPTQCGGLIFIGQLADVHLTDAVITGGKTTPDGRGDQIYANSGARITLDGDTRVDGGFLLGPGVDLTLADRVKILRGDRYPLYADASAARIDAAALTDGAEIWVTTPAVPQTLATAASAAQAAYFHYDGEGRIAFSDGTVSAAELRIPGDLTGDDKVNGKDAVLLQRFLAGGYGVELDETAADLTGDGKVNGKDAVLLQRYLAGGYGVTLG